MQQNDAKTVLLGSLGESLVRRKREEALKNKKHNKNKKARNGCNKKRRQLALVFGSAIRQVCADKSGHFILADGR